MLVNTLIHREMTSSYVAKFVIENDKMYVENANRSARDGYITPENLEPNPKNPLIAAFFRNIGLSDQLGSGVRNLFRYGKLYSGKEPQMKEGDIFKITVPLNEEYSFDLETKVGEKVGDIHLTDNQKKILDALLTNPELSAGKLSSVIGISSRKIELNIKKLKELGMLARIGSPRKGYWEVKKD